MTWEPSSVGLQHLVDAASAVQQGPVDPEELGVEQATAAAFLQDVADLLERAPDRRAVALWGIYVGVMAERSRRQEQDDAIDDEIDAGIESRRA
jgi:hypothetical protein